MKQIFYPGITSVLISSLLLSLPLSVSANTSNPNGSSRKPAPGWSLWRPKAEMDQADFSAGFSNIELGGYMDFENACATSSGLPPEKIEYWFRLSNSVNRIGTGQVEYGCWVGGRFLNTFTSTAIKTSWENVECLQVNSRTGKRLVIRSEPRENSRQLGTVSNGTKVNPGSFPASIVQTQGINWLAISSPRQGWISDGSPTSEGNLRLCRRK
jgi:hypothetical protein